MVVCHISEYVDYQIPVFTVASLFLRSYGELNHVVDSHGLLFQPKEGQYSYWRKKG